LLRVQGHCANKKSISLYALRATQLDVVIVKCTSVKATLNQHVESHTAFLWVVLTNSSIYSSFESVCGKLVVELGLLRVIQKLWGPIHGFLFFRHTPSLHLLPCYLIYIHCPQNAILTSHYPHPCLPMALSCNLLPQIHSTTPLPFTQILGDDCPADPATDGYFISPASVTVYNITVTKEWYSTVLGMRYMFTLDISNNYTIMHMGHAQGGKTSRGYQSGTELARDKNHLGGLIEFVEYQVSQSPFINRIVHVSLWIRS
jgi:hypothetical protein